MEGNIIRVATFNIHRLTNPDSLDEILSNNNIDICGMQEVPGIRRLRAVLSDEWACLFDGGYPNYGVGLVYRKDKFAFVKQETHVLKNTPGKKTAFEVWLALVNQPSIVVKMFVTHLDHRTEEQRLAEIACLTKILPCDFHILMGDFNALTRSDYTDEEWAKIASIRAECQPPWEVPVTHVTDKILGLGYIDALTDCKTVMPTCRFDTRVDYIYMYGIKHERAYVANGHGASDHNIVIVDINLTPANPAL